MASALALLKRMDVSSYDLGNGAIDLVASTAAGYGASVGIGYAYGRYRDHWAGEHAPKIAGAIGKGGAALLSVLGGGNAGLLGSVLNTIGQSGVDMLGAKFGIEKGFAARQKMLVSKPKAALAAGEQVFGALGPAAPGRGLSDAQIEALAAMH